MSSRIIPTTQEGRHKEDRIVYGVTRKRRSYGLYSKDMSRGNKGTYRVRTTQDEWLERLPPTRRVTSAPGRHRGRSLSSERVLSTLRISPARRPHARAPSPRHANVSRSPHRGRRSSTRRMSPTRGGGRASSSRYDTERPRRRPLVIHRDQSGTRHAGESQPQTRYAHRPLDPKSGSHHPSYEQSRREVRVVMTNRSIHSTDSGTSFRGRQAPPVIHTSSRGPRTRSPPRRRSPVPQGTPQPSVLITINRPHRRGRRSPSPSRPRSHLRERTAPPHIIVEPSPPPRTLRRDQRDCAGASTASTRGSSPPFVYGGNSNAGSRVDAPTEPAGLSAVQGQAAGVDPPWVPAVGRDEGGVWVETPDWRDPTAAQSRFPATPPPMPDWAVANGAAAAAQPRSAGPAVAAPLAGMGGGPGVMYMAPQVVGGGVHWGWR